MREDGAGTRVDMARAAAAIGKILSARYGKVEVTAKRKAPEDQKEKVS